MARLKAILLFTLIFFMLLGCASPASTTPPQPETTTSPTRTPIPTETKVPPTLTFTSTPTPTTTPTWTPLPTLVDQNSFLDFISFTEGSICKFPCWAGIVLGKTSWDEAIFSLRPIEAVAKLDISPNQESSHGKVNIISWYFYGGEFEVDGEFITGSGTDLIWMNIQSFSIPTENTPSHSLPLLRRFNIQSILK